ncbi:GPI transamidase subunit PIG-U [Dictyocaulus viviparus]|uniref:GPI transamidase subunit PIG-U n=1 Tax=Dictyocaulus viviparus TaxID=29172 RepID=A0A0D8Y4R5_DICVI|nr:GPI transamidase subunit PIG-U [Dictyocaulus viviparus]
MSSYEKCVLGKKVAKCPPIRFRFTNRNFPILQCFAFIVPDFALKSPSRGLLLPCVLVLSLCISLSIYPVIIAASVLLRFSSLHQRIFTLFCLTSGFVAMLIFNWFLNNMNWNFLDDTYGFILRVDDLTPNVGLFWYFFTQVFEHFRVFYLVVFQINLLVYVVPLLLSLRKDAYLHLVISLLLMAVFSSYPTLNDASTYLALLPMLDKYWKYPRYTLVVSCTIVTCVVLMPVMWHIWIVVGSGNANFYFAVTLIYNIAQNPLVLFRKRINNFVTLKNKQGLTKLVKSFFNSFFLSSFEVKVVFKWRKLKLDLTAIQMMTYANCKLRRKIFL